MLWRLFTSTIIVCWTDHTMMCYQLHIEWCHSNNLKLAVVVVFTPLEIGKCDKPGIFPLGELAVKRLPRHLFCTQQCGREKTLEGEGKFCWPHWQGHKLWSREQNSKLRGKHIYPVERSLGLLGSFKGIPCPTPNPARLLLVQEVPPDDFHGKVTAPQNRPIGHTNPKSKIELYRTGRSCYLFLQVKFISYM